MADACDGGLAQHRHPLHVWRNLLEQLQPFGTEAVLEHGKTSGVAARSRKAGDQARADWVDDPDKGDRDCPAQALQHHQIGAVAAKTTSGVNASKSAASLRMRSGSRLLAP